MNNEHTNVSRRNRKGPRKQGETLDLPYRYLVRDSDGTLRASGIRRPGESAILMGTHESEEHAAKRAGWS